MTTAERVTFNSKICLKSEAALLKILGHPLRLKIVAKIQMQECNVKNIWECLEQEQAVVSQHLAVLKKHGIISGTRRGAEMRYVVVNPMTQRVITALMHPA